MRQLARTLCILMLISQFLAACQTAYAQTSSQETIATSWTATDWQKVSEVGLSDLVKQILSDKENTRIPPDSPPLDVSRAIITKIQQAEQGKVLYLVTLGSQQLCGSGGCQYYGYVTDGSTYRKVFNQLLDSRLPPELEFLQVTNQISSGLPCLQFTQLENIMSSDRLRLSRFCYDGETYKLVDESIQKNSQGQD